MEEQIRTVKRKIAIHLISTNLMETLYAIFPAYIHKNRCADDIGLQEDCRILYRTVNMAFSREIDNHIRLLFFKDSVDALTVADVFLIEDEVWMG